MTNYLRPAFQGPKGAQIDVSMSFSSGKGAGEIFLADGLRVVPDAFGIIIVDHKDVPALLRAGWVVTAPTQPVAGTAASAQAFATTAIVDYAALVIYGKVTLGGQAPAGASIGGLAVAVALDGASSPFGTTVSAADGSWRVSYARLSPGLQSVLVSVAGAATGAVTFTVQ